MGDTQQQLFDQAMEGIKYSVGWSKSIEDTIMVQPQAWKDNTSESEKHKELLTNIGLLLVHNNRLLGTIASLLLYDEMNKANAADSAKDG